MDRDGNLDFQVFPSLKTVYIYNNIGVEDTLTDKVHL